MTQSIEESLLQAIKKDDTKAFRALMANSQCGAYRFGRFPVLSLLYLYHSRKILSAHEESFLKISSYTELREPVEVSKKFSDQAGKCLRLYREEAVSPLEMLLILDKTKHLKRVYPMTKPSEAVKERLQSIYSIKYSLNISFSGNDIIIEKRPLSPREKKKIITLSLCSVLAVAVAVSVPVTTVALIPKPVEGEVTSLNQIEFGSQKEYTLKRDIAIPENFSVNQVNCTIKGEGKKLTFGKGANLGELNGKMSDLIIESCGDAILKTVSQSAAFENIIVNVKADVTASEGAAFIAVNNYGTIDGVTVNVSGKLTAVSASTEVTEELTFGSIVWNNNFMLHSVTQTVDRGTIKNCTVNYSEFTLIGEASANASFGGVAGINNGYLQDCIVSGAINADTFDLAGICSVNNGFLSGDVNNANLSQTSADTDWNPIVCGIVLTNTYAVENCENKGTVSSVSICGYVEVQEGFEPTASASGIAYLNSGTAANLYISGCTNAGSITCSAEHRSIYAAGVCLSSNGGIANCKNVGAVTTGAENGNPMYVGGITTVANGDVYRSVNEGAISVTGSGVTYVGGISALTRARLVNCLSSGEMTVTAQDIYAGGIFGVSDIVALNYWGNAENCICECKITATVIDDTLVDTSVTHVGAVVGGVAGFIRQAKLENTNLYFGGCILNCYFTGECGSEITYFGNIIGVCGANLYENNAYTLGDITRPNFEGNYFVTNSRHAFGSLVTQEGNFVAVENGNKGATAATKEEIENSEGYQSILNALNQ